jgi:tetratricopeptide (TPR) repeat protein
MAVRLAPPGEVSRISMMRTPQRPATLPDRESRRRGLLLGAAATVLSGAVYLNALRNPFVFDDRITIVDNPSILDIGDLRAILLSSIFRPVVNLSYALDHALWGLEPFGYHLTSVLLHMVNVVLLFAVTVGVVEDGQARDQQETGSTTRASGVAFIASALFGVHPMMTEAVGYASARPDVLSASFFLLAFLSMRRGWVAGRYGWIVAALLPLGLGLASKEVVVMFPFVMLAYDRLLFPGSDEARRRRLLRLHVPLIAVIIVAVAARALVFFSVESPSSSAAIGRIWKYLLLEFEVIWRYVLLLALPVSQSIVHRVRPSGMLSLAGAAGLAVVGLLMLRGRRRAPLAAFAAVWFLLLLAPSSSLLPLQYPMAEHRVYLASGGLFIAAGAGFGWLLGRLTRWSAAMRPVAYAAGALLLGVLSILTVARNGVWADPVSLWRDAARKAPSMWQAHSGLGEALQDGRNCDEAIPAYEAAVRLAPRRMLLHAKLRACLVEVGRLEEARRVGRTILEMDPQLARLCREVQEMTTHLERREDCVERYRRWLEASGG